MTEEKLLDMTIKQLDAWCEANDVPEKWKPGTTKAVFVGRIMDLCGEPEAPIVEEPEPEPVKEEPKRRPNGEIIKLAKDGKDYGTNWHNSLNHPATPPDNRRNRLPKDKPMPTRIARELKR